MPSYAYPPPRLDKETSTTISSFLRTVILLCIAGAAVSSREFAVVRFESIIHEFDPWFNYRATMTLTKDGFYEFWNWFDPTAWYPLGRVVGGTLYPGLMVTSGLIWKALHSLSIPVDIREVCVQLAPMFSGLTAFATYLFAREVGKDGSRESTGLWAALFIGIAPGYISRSVAGSYDNEAIAIFILMFTFYLWIKTVKTGSITWAGVTALFYYYMVAAWGGYAFITNMLPLHVFVLLLMGRYTSRLYVAYSTFYAIGTLSSMTVPFVGFLPLLTSEHMAPLGVFGLLQLIAFVQLVRSHVPEAQFKVLFRAALGVGLTMIFGGLWFMTRSGKIQPWTGRFYSLWDTGYARIHLPLVSSVSEHQPTAWPSFFFDLNFLIYLFPAGVFICFRELRDEHVFVIIYSFLASYFAGVMVRLMLTLTPVVCVSAAMAISSVFETYLDPVQPDTTEDIVAAMTEDDGTKPTKDAKTTSKRSNRRLSSTKAGVWGLDVRAMPIIAFTFLASLFVLHCTWVTSTAYSSPSVVLSSRNADGSNNIIDDFREAYYWLRQNTKEDAKIMSWWDYGYQIAGFSNRTTLVDNNTWNNTHIATVGKMMSLNEEAAYPLLRQHDVDYVLVIFGGLLGFGGDDINKFLWMVRISEGIWPQEINEQKYFTSRGEFKVDADASEVMKNSLMYKMSYYRFAEVFGGGQAHDRVRGQVIPNTPIQLDTLEEAFTSENWIVRIYAVKKEDSLGRDLKSANAFAGGKRKKRVKPAKKNTLRRGA
ncbi:dolichyl-diphosphooligosaccharide-protein glycosyltransferase subunit stt3 [Microbotryum lychnidis-dioicae p1A1 Lamole]|uniref:Dolichyl-diphosphooligosaccharide--protein glycosyltransferase subunit STT3 n=1 Tax=Microbotryum lychnidis-dioicae (strain p1A1 Lamole / MvSl-1064) TaxID=683840 RepID=U5H4F0_USTV1|nr:dolichyl-diphosphooligosaccharide-protein glycosyltransferase subunit stt3 [Microbotryum lychnidis-dioicae p1A1 Lamole]|eukprot:KDE07519.1 dolichyl-diphosphooligosaccharide-protein glycosyltransferase subunit stt3 [Microbotryum lychnidis-dioicae p1A1 Lamole]